MVRVILCAIFGMCGIWAKHWPPVAYQMCLGLSMSHSGKGTSFGEIGELIGKITGVHDVVRFNERPLGEKEPRIIVADTTRQQLDLGFNAPISLETGLSDYSKTLKQDLCIN